LASSLRRALAATGQTRAEYPHRPLHKVLAIGQCDRLRPVVHAELAEDVLNVCPACLRGDEELARDRLLLEPLREQAKNLPLPGRQLHSGQLAGKR
jgi:hypothetical protein